jgi:hypothetical protein
MVCVERKKGITFKQNQFQKMQTKVLKVEKLAEKENQ